jgi:hypothetical protein
VHTFKIIFLSITTIGREPVEDKLGTVRVKAAYQSDGYFVFPVGLHVQAYAAAIWFSEISRSNRSSTFRLISISESRKTIFYSNEVIRK